MILDDVNSALDRIVSHINCAVKAAAESPGNAFYILKEAIEQCMWNTWVFNMFIKSDGKLNEQEVDNMCFEVLNIPKIEVGISSEPSKLSLHIRGKLIQLKSSYDNTYDLTQPTKQWITRDLEGRVKAIKYNAKILNESIARLKWFIGDLNEECIEHFRHHGVTEDALKATQASFDSQELQAIGGGFFETEGEMAGWASPCALALSQEVSYGFE